MKKIILLLLVNLSLVNGFAQKHVGIGTSNPLAALHVADSSVLFSAGGDVPANPHNVAINGAGRRMMWYPDKAAFRAGYATGNEWDSVNIGNYSFAAGRGANAIGSSSFAYGDGAIAFGGDAVAIGRKNFAATSGFAIGDTTRATGLYSTAMGKGTKSAGYASTSLGMGTTASGEYSFSAGYGSTASGGFGSVAMGNYSNSSGEASVALGESTASGGTSTATGFLTTASGEVSTAMGYSSIASGNYSTAIGVRSIASGDFSTAMGVYASTNNHNYSFCIGGKSDGTTNSVTLNSADNQMMMRFDNYTFWVSSSNYAYLIPASNGWAYTSDRNKKERLEELDGETVLQKISAIPFYSWNFKAADIRQYRHYGIMAQDFYNAFGKDSYGDIGNDTTVSPLDMLGVDMAAIKALEKRSTSLVRENEKLKADNLALQDKMAAMQQQFEISGQQNKLLADKLAMLEQKMNELAVAKEPTVTSKNVLPVKK